MITLLTLLHQIYASAEDIFFDAMPHMPLFTRDIDMICCRRHIQIYDIVVTTNGILLNTDDA